MAMQRSVVAAVLLAAGMLALLWSPQPASGEVGSRTETMAARPPA